MLKGLLTKIVGDANEKELDRLRPIVERINALEPEMERRSDEELRARTQEFKERIARATRELRERLAEKREVWERETDFGRRQGLELEIKGLEAELRRIEEEILDDILVEAFAMVREASKRTIGLRHFDVQLMGGIVLHEGKVAEMKTGEGKTLVATLPLYLNALTGRGVHLVTVNDYLAKRDTQWMGPIYHLLGLSVGVIQHESSYLFDPDYPATDDRYRNLRPCPRREAYLADITYGTNNEFGFDYLRDNMVYDLSQCVQRELNYAIIDEVDNILIDEARTPLIISGPAEESADLYLTFARLVPRLRPDVDYTVDEKLRAVTLTEEGIARIEGWLGIDNLYSPQHYHLTPYLDNALRAHVLYKRDRDYIVKDGQVIIVDEFTGRLMYGRRYSEGLHQAIEAKEGVRVQRESLTLATITFQNFFRMYRKLAGMTGTAATEAEEFRKIYNLDVVVIPTHKPMIRIDHPDVVYKSEEAKLRAAVKEIIQLHCQGRPVLVGTVFIEKSERLSSRLSSAMLQALARVTLLREALREAEDMDKEERNHWNAFLSRPLEELEQRALIRLARTLGLNPDPLAEENISRLAQLLSVKDRERLRQVLRKGIPHQVLNAKHHEKEAAIIAQAGRVGAVTIATNMAGRGVDILLGGNPEGLAREKLRREGVDLTEIRTAQWDDAVKMLREGQDPTSKYPERWAQVLAETFELCRQEQKKVLELGGLHILGTERHEARRIDNQLRGRAGRQGDPGSSRFYISLEDDLMRRFGGHAVASLMERLGVDEDIPIESRLVSKQIESAQKRVEGYNFDLRKHVLEYDDVVNKQREVIYRERRRILKETNLKPSVLKMVKEELSGLVDLYTSSPDEGEWDLTALHRAVQAILPLPPTITAATWKELGPEDIKAQLCLLAEELYEEKERRLGSETMRLLERLVMLRAVDTRWVRHLTDLDDLREGIGLRAYGQQDPLVAFKREAHEMYQELLAAIQHDITHSIYYAELVKEPRPRPMREVRPRAMAPAAPAAPRPAERRRVKLGRNDPCWCGSGKKYKHCHMRQDMEQGYVAATTAPHPHRRSSKRRRRRR